MHSIWVQDVCRIVSYRIVSYHIVSCLWSPCFVVDCKISPHLSINMIYIWNVFSSCLFTSSWATAGLRGGLSRVSGSSGDCDGQTGDQSKLLQSSPHDDHLLRCVLKTSVDRRWDGEADTPLDATRCPHLDLLPSKKSIKQTPIEQISYTSASHRMTG